MFEYLALLVYLEELKRWPKQDQDAAAKIPQHLAENPYVGKPLNYLFLREKKIAGRRVYYLIYDDLKLVLLVATSEKKDQQNTINHIKMYFDQFREIAEKISRQVS